MNIIYELYTGFTKEKYAEMLQDMTAYGYKQIVALNENNEVVGLSGYWINTRLWCGKYVDIDNVIVAEKHRSKGIGKLMMDWIINEAKRLGCENAVLDAYVENLDAHRFYYREGFIIRGFHFLKSLK